MADITASENAILMAHSLELASEKLANYAQLLFTVAEAFEANEDTAPHGWALRPIAEGIQDIADDCHASITRESGTTNSERVA